MSPELSLTRPRLAVAMMPAAWRQALARVALCWSALVLLFARDWVAMAGQWWNSSTYNHILLIPALVVWLVWLRLPQLALLRPTLFWPALAAVAGAVLVWMLGAFAGVELARQAGAVLLLPVSAVVLLGPRIAAALLFPLAYMVFLVPFGDELVPTLQMITAELTIALTRLSGIPAQINGVFIDTPAGLFEVAEACSGVKFLVAMVALGALVANVCFRSWRRRAAFMAIAVIVPIIANGIRAWGTIQIAQIKGAAYASGVDHIVYGWVFFAVVLALVLALGWRFFDRALDAPMVDADALLQSPVLDRLGGMTISLRAAVTAIALVVIAGQSWVLAATRLAAPMPPRIDLPEVAGWQRVDYAPAVPWSPRAAGADHRLLGRYRDAAGREVDVFYALYARQGDGSEAGGFGEGALVPGSEWSWAGPEAAPIRGRADRLLARGKIERLAETYYRTGDTLTGSAAQLRLVTLTDRMALRARPTMLLILSAERRPGYPPATSLAAFRASAGPMAAWMDRAAQPR